MAELRKDPVLGRWVAVATERVRRPTDFRGPRAAQDAGPCMFCAGHEHETPPEIAAHREVVDDGEPGLWRVRVVPHRFPALRIEGDLERRGHGLYDLMNGIGAHEVVVESPHHGVQLPDLPESAIADVLRAYQERIADLRHDSRFRAIVVLRTHGLDVAAPLGHARSQLVAMPVIPPALTEELHHARAYHDYRERCLFCDILHQEDAERQRLVAASEHVLAFAPFAARHAFETWILPRRHAAGFDTVRPPELVSLAAVLRSVLCRLRRALDDPPYLLLLHSAPFAETESPYYHWHVEILPQLGPALGVERGGLLLNPIPPEDAARFLRETSV